MQRTPTTLQPRLAAQTRSSGPHHERVADPRFTAVASCCMGGCDPSSVITAYLFCCAVHVVSCVRCVARLARAVKKKEYGSLVIWSNGHDARFWIFDGVSSSLAESMSIFFSKPRHHRQHRHHTSNAGCVLQPAGYNAIHACRLPAEHEATPQSCGILSALYYCCGFLFNTRSSRLPLLSDPAISGVAVSYTHLTLPTIYSV